MSNFQKLTASQQADMKALVKGLVASLDVSKGHTHVAFVGSAEKKTLAITALTGDRAALDAAVDAFAPAPGKGSITDTLAAAAAQLTQHGRPDAVKHTLLVSRATSMPAGSWSRAKRKFGADLQKLEAVESKLALLIAADSGKGKEATRSRQWQQILSYDKSKKMASFHAVPSLKDAAKEEMQKLVTQFCTE